MDRSLYKFELTLLSQWHVPRPEVLVLSVDSFTYMHEGMLGGSRMMSFPGQRRHFSGGKFKWMVKS